LPVLWLRTGNRNQTKAATNDFMSLETQSGYFHAFEWLRPEALKNNKHAQVLMPRLGNLEKDQFVPGEWYCPKCGFECYKRLLSAKTMNVAADTTIADEACPNDGELMLQQTWKWKVESLAKAFKTQVQRAVAAESHLKDIAVNLCGVPEA
jgi:hypothetical protein